jgi:hypothetical protein
MVFGATGRQKYGEILSCDDNGGRGRIASLKQFSASDGLLVLEVQERLMSFLVECCRAILGGIHNAEPTPKPVQISPALRLRTETGSFPTLATLASEAPYRVPARTDFERMESLLEAKMLAARDHIWALREDPRYFLEAVQDVKQHRLETKHDTNCNEHPIYRHTDVFWARITSTLAVQAYDDLQAFLELHRQAKELCTRHSTYAARVSPQEDLPGEFLTAILRFEYYLERLAKAHQIRQLRDCLPVSTGGMNNYFDRLPPRDRLTPQIQVTRAKTDDTPRLLWLFEMLWEDDERFFPASMTTIVDELELEGLLETARYSVGVSPWIAGVVGGLSIVTPCLAQLKLYQP